MVATPPDHYRKAEKLLAEAKGKWDAEEKMPILTAALVHATLATCPPIVASRAQDDEDALHG